MTATYCAAGWCKTLALATAALAFSAPIALARSDEMNGVANYEVPTPGRSDLAPYRVFRIHDYKVAMNQAGKHVLSFALPADLTGGKRIPITLTADRDTAETEPVDFRGPNGTAHCVPRDGGGDWDRLDCTYRLHSLPIDRQQATNYLDLKYGSGSASQRQKEVAYRFMGEPIGILNMESDDDSCFDCRLSNGEWNITYTNPQGQPVNAQMSVDRTRGSYFLPGGRGTLTQITHDGNDTATGLWRFNNGATGWLRFNYNADGRSFSGEWGNGMTPGQARVGTWNGRRVF